MRETNTGKDSEEIKNVKIIVGVLFAFISIIVFFQMAPEHHGAGLLGVFSGSLIVFGTGVGLVYSTQYKRIQKEKKREVQYEKERQVKNNYFEKKEKLESLKKKGLITELEFQQKFKIIIDPKIDHEIKKSREFEELQFLLDSGVFTQDEFDKKVIVLKKEASRKQSLDQQDFADPSPYSFIGNYYDGMAKVLDKNLNYGFIDQSNNLIVKTEYEFAEDFSEELAVVRLGGKFGYINTEGKVIISFLYDEASGFEGGVAAVRVGKKKLKINKQGHNVVD